jgi:hypothetical protein
MKVVIDIPDYTPYTGFRFIWDDDPVIATKIYKDKMYIAANPAGLRSLAYHLLTLAQDTVAMGRDIDYIERHGHWPGLEHGSPPLIITKVPDAEAAKAALTPLSEEEQERRRALRDRFNEHMRRGAAKPRPTDD